MITPLTIQQQTRAKVRWILQPTNERDIVVSHPSEQEQTLAHIAIDLAAEIDNLRGWNQSLKAQVDALIDILMETSQ